VGSQNVDGFRAPLDFHLEQQFVWRERREPEAFAHDPKRRDGAADIKVDGVGQESVGRLCFDVQRGEDFGWKVAQVRR
jgi:hypothetical protein